VCSVHTYADHEYTLIHTIYLFTLNVCSNLGDHFFVFVLSSIFIILV